MPPRSHILLVLVLLTRSPIARAGIPDSTGIIEPFPILSYDTDAGFGYGMKIVFRNTLGTSESFDLTLFNSTKGERWYRLAFSLPDAELRQGTIYPLAVDILLDYDKWIRNSFFGIGRNSSFDDREYYTKEPFELTATISRGFSPVIVGQLGMRYKIVRNYGFQAGSRLAALDPPISGSRASFFSFFTSARYDTRNSYINPSRGLVLQGDAEYAPESSLGNCAFTKVALWIQSYTPLPVPEAVLAFRFGLQSVAGKELPVQVLMSLGGNRDLRGSPQDRYCDRACAVTNAEIRFPIVWRFGAVAAVDAGSVFGSLDRMTVAHWIISPAVGLRFYMETFVVRLDVGFGSESTGFYLNFGQLF